jgi:hypothetical protein
MNLEHAKTQRFLLNLSVLLTRLNKYRQKVAALMIQEGHALRTFCRT